MTSSQKEIKRIVTEGTLQEKKSFYAFTISDPDEIILFKFNLWIRRYFPQYFESKDAEFHAEIDRNNLLAYKGNTEQFIDAAFRGASKTSRTKLFLGFVIANDIEHFRKYIKVLAADKNNSIQIVTDVYNMFMHPEIAELYPEVFVKTARKREETMGSFTTSTGIKVIADTIGTDQRGALQEASRPDLILFEDFENRVTLRSAIKTRAIWDNMEEARTGLAVGGSCIYNCNYVSEMGNVHRLITQKNDRKVVLIIPILTKEGKSAWESRYSLEDIERMRKSDDDFEGERMCQPSASKDVMFDRERIERMPVLQPVKESAGFKIYKEFDPMHRYGGGHDVAGGVELDSSTSVYIDFETFPAQVVATFASNTIKPEQFGAEIGRQTLFYGNCIEAIENNKYDTAVSMAKQCGCKLYMTEGKETRIGFEAPKTYGWNTNTLTKPKMMFALMKAVEDGHIELNDADLIAEAKGYSRNDLMDKEEDPRLATRHFDLLIAAAIAWQMKDHARVKTVKEKKFKPITKQRTGPRII